ncbi:MAG: multifunctional oxoglutarate decarboxylase/oxoglutarate dehydrogenase thiamine pyrophosphate-binding subunit/dihydrolipoyllysine-residue succinyltransferase subunit, partial [Mycobacterium sp.]
QELPANFHPHRQIEKLIADRTAMASGEKPLNWGMAELLAFASLVTEGVRVRLTGQDAARGTFSHRHAVLHDVETGSTHMPLCHLAPDQAPIEIYNSPLSEAAVLGFEYGYSLDWPDSLVLWEAQFGDFVNAAQVIIDQFIVSAEDKWKRLSGLVLLLPHGYEGQGPEHSSARLERFLALAAEENIQVAQPTTPAQIFHLLRRQALRPWRKPLIVFTPKSLLRLPQATSPLSELAEGRFQRVIPDPRTPEARAAKKTTRVLMCTGKIFYDIEKRRHELGREDIEIVRVEQLYPLPNKRLRRTLDEYPNAEQFFWVQEEPANQGAWPTFGLAMPEQLPDKLTGIKRISRRAMSAPSSGSSKVHAVEQQEIIDEAFG